MRGPARPGRRLLAAAALALFVGTAPDPAVAPAAAAHDRDALDLRAAATLEVGRADAVGSLSIRDAFWREEDPEEDPEAGVAEAAGPGATAHAAWGATWSATWASLGPREEEPPTPRLIEAQLDALVAEARRARRAAEAQEPLRFGDTVVPRGLAETILRAAAATDVDPAYMMALADKESSFRTEVQARTSSAEGLFQFIARSWLAAVKEFGPRHGLETEAALIAVRDGEPTIADERERERVLALRRDPYVAGLMAGEVLKRDRARIEQRLGRGLKASELYFAHFLGQAGAGRLMELAGDRPKAPAAAAFRAAAKANRSLFTEGSGRRRRSLTVAEVYGRIDRMIDDRLDRFADVATRVGTAERVGEAGRVRLVEVRID